MALRTIRTLDDLSSRTPWDQGFFRLRRLLLQNVYLDGTQSQPYRCDVLERRGVDAVVVFLYRWEGEEVRVLFRECIRPAVYLRRERPHAIEDGRQHTILIEAPAGILEPEDRGLEGVKARAAIEAEEEAGVRIAPEDVRLLGHGAFSAPGIMAEKIFFATALFDPATRKEPKTDGSPFEERGAVFELSLDEALARIEEGALCDMKTEVGLRRLAAALRQKTI